MSFHITHQIQPQATLSNSCSVRVDLDFQCKIGYSNIIQYCFNILLELQGLSPPHYITLLGAHIELRALSHTQPHHNFQASYMEFKIKMEPMFITLCCLGSRSIITYIGVYRGYGYPLTPLFMNAIIAFIVVISLHPINGRINIISCG